MRLFSLTVLIACSPGSAVTKYDVLDDAVTTDSGVTDTATEPSSEPSGEPSNEASSEPSSEPGAEPSTEPSSEPSSEPGSEPSTEPLEDNDGDGFTEDVDCDDTDPSVNPNAQEILDDGIDQDCSGADLSCNNTSTVEWIVDFPSTSGCDWGNNGNLSATQGEISAREEQESVYTVPSGSGICGIRPLIQANQDGHFQAFEFDDDAMMVYNDYVLFSTNDSLTDPLQSGSWQGKLYDWDLMKGADFNGYTWSWGNASTASLGAGTFYVSIQNGKMDKVHDISIANGEIRFMLVTFGDNDDAGDSDGADCAHDGLSFPVEIDLAQ